MRLRLFPYFVKQALNNIKTNRVVHLIGLGTMVISLLIFGAFLMLFVNLNAWVQGWGGSLSMSIYLKDGISDASRDKIAVFLKDMDGVEIDRYISKERAMGDLRKALGFQAGLLEGLSYNPLPASFEVILKEVNENTDPEKVKNTLETFEGVDDIQYSEDWQKKIAGLMNMVRLIGFIVGGLLCLGVLFIVTNTIKIAIYSRRDEIEILKLVGATDWFVKIPFLIEGIIQGVISGILALSTLYLGYVLLSMQKSIFFGQVVFNVVFIPFEVVLSMVLISVFLGLAGSFIAVGRFFEV